MIRADQKQTHHQPGKKEGSTDDRGREQSSTRVAVAPAIRSESESHGHAPWSPSSACGLPFSGRLRSSLSLWLSPSPMARPRKPPPPSPPKAAAPSIADALLLATVCMVGLPVEVRVRDGSTYSGVLHTACVDAGYGELSVLPSPPAASLRSSPSLGLPCGDWRSRECRSGRDPTAGGVGRWVLPGLLVSTAHPAPRFPAHPFDLLAGRVAVVAWSPRESGCLFCRCVGMDLEAGGRDRGVCSIFVLQLFAAKISPVSSWSRWLILRCRGNH